MFGRSFFNTVLINELKFELSGCDRLKWNELDSWWIREEMMEYVSEQVS